MNNGEGITLQLQNPIGFLYHQSYCVLSFQVQLDFWITGLFYYGTSTLQKHLTGSALHFKVSLTSLLFIVMTVN